MCPVQVDGSVELFRGAKLGQSISLVAFINGPCSVGLYGPYVLCLSAGGASTGTMAMEPNKKKPSLPFKDSYNTAQMKQGFLSSAVLQTEIHFTSSEMQET